MGVFKRVGDILSASLNELVERFESPELMLRQALREMDAAIDRTLEATARAIADERLLEERIARCRAKVTTLQQSARTAVVRGDDEAARRALLICRDDEKLTALLEEQLIATQGAAARMRRRLEAMRRRRAAAERKLHIVSARQRVAEAERHFLARGFDPGDASPGFSRFERLCRRVERQEAEADALLELSGAAGSDVIPPVEQMETAEIESQLEALKQECRR